VVSFTPRPLYPQGKSLWYPLDRRLGVFQSRSGRGGEEINSQPLPRFEPPIIQLVDERYTTELSRLHIGSNERDIMNDDFRWIWKNAIPICFKVLTQRLTKPTIPQSEQQNS
jgi:hypothetical protein